MRQFADFREPVPASLRQLRQPEGRLPPPVAQHAGPEALGDLRISRDVAGVDQAERHGEIVRCDRPGLRDGSHRMVKGDTRVPDRVEDPIGDCGDVATVAMQQQHVEIAAGKEFAPAVAAHGHERTSRCVDAGGSASNKVASQASDSSTRAERRSAALTVSSSTIAARTVRKRRPDRASAPTAPP